MPILKHKGLLFDTDEEAITLNVSLNAKDFYSRVKEAFCTKEFMAVEIPVTSMEFNHLNTCYILCKWKVNGKVLDHNDGKWYSYVNTRLEE